MNNTEELSTGLWYDCKGSGLDFRYFRGRHPGSDRLVQEHNSPATGAVDVEYNRTQIGSLADS